MTVNANIKTEFFIFNELSVLMARTERSYPKNVTVAKLCSHNLFNRINCKEKDPKFSIFLENREPVTTLELFVFQPISVFMKLKKWSKTLKVIALVDFMRFLTFWTIFTKYTTDNDVSNSCLLEERELILKHLILDTIKIISSWPWFFQ